jgi:mono/diheme cytochrome c family protein
MQHWLKPLSLVSLLAAAPSTFVALPPDQLAKLPPPASRTVDFARDIQPILEASCTKCHGRGKAKGDFQIDTRETLLKGGESGAAVVIGKSGESLLIEMVSGLNPENVMPQKGSRLKPEQVGLVRAWIDQGLPWTAGVSLGKPPPVNLTPREVALPPARKGLEHPVDRLLEPYFKANKVKPAKRVEDRVFVRRVYLDVIGLLPTPAELNEFVTDTRQDKRAQLVRKLLADNQRYAEHWLTFWNDLLRNDYKGTGYIDGGRKQITGWLYNALAKNLPYDQFVAQLINPTPDSEGFTKGIVWRGVVNASQTPQMQAAQNISQVFMGVNLKCASCHDSFINDWTLADAYGLASIYATNKLEMVHCDKPTGKVATVKFLYPELGGIDGSADKSARMKQLAEVITSKQDARLTRTLVNRLWAKFMGRGLVEPADDMERPAWNQDLLDWLAQDFAANGHDVRRLIERILTSTAYQLPATSLAEQRDGGYVFRGPAVRRMSAEQFRDALLTVTGNGYSLPAGDYDFAAAYVSALPTSSLASEASVQPLWIWNNPKAAEKTRPETLYLRRTFVLDAEPGEASAIVACDNSFTLYANGTRVGGGNTVARPGLFDLRPHLRVGTNLLAISAVNEPPPKPPAKPGDRKDPKESKPTEQKTAPAENEAGKAGDDKAIKAKPAEAKTDVVKTNEVKSAETVVDSDQPERKDAADKKPAAKATRSDNATPAGLLFYARAVRRYVERGIPMATIAEIRSDRSWTWAVKRAEDWERPEFVATNWAPAVELGDLNMAPWKLDAPFSTVREVMAHYGSFRAPLVAADPLMTALGRPNREQVLTARSSAATTLQALELTNGATLDTMLKRGAEKLLSKSFVNTAALVEQVFVSALSRRPTANEGRFAEDALGRTPQNQGVADLLWALTMLPEFQLIY